MEGGREGGSASGSKADADADADETPRRQSTYHGAAEVGVVGSGPVGVGPPGDDDGEDHPWHVARGRAWRRARVGAREMRYRWGGKEIDSSLCARAYACVHACVHIASWSCTSLVARTTTTEETPTEETQAYLVVAGTG